LSALGVTIVGSIFATTLTYVWLSTTETAHDAVTLFVLAGALVLADTPRQILVYGKRYGVAFGLSGVYAFAALLGLLFSLAWAKGGLLMAAWCGGSLASFGMGLLLQRRVPRGFSRSLRVRAYRWTLSAEALYLGLVNQLAILILYWTAAPETTAGYRLAYSLVFAPAFMVIQGLAPM
jgi:hypothetical protein